MSALALSLLACSSVILILPKLIAKSIFIEFRTLYLTEIAIVAIFIIPLMFDIQGTIILSAFLAMFCAYEIICLSSKSTYRWVIKLTFSALLYLLILLGNSQIKMISLFFLYPILILQIYKAANKIRINKANLFFYPAVLSAFIPPMASFKHGITFIIFTYLVTEVFDSFALIVGKAFGKRPMFPVLSPKKTVAGLIGGTFAAVISGTFFANIMGWNVLLFGLFSLLFCVTSILGDLVASSIKRQLGVKEYGNFLPLQGGILDIYDSILFNIPIMYCVLFFLNFKLIH